MIEKILSRGFHGAEQAALEVAHVFGIATGGCPWPAAPLLGDAFRLGVETDEGAKALAAGFKQLTRLSMEALRLNARDADGTLITNDLCRGEIRALTRWDVAWYIIWWKNADAQAAKDIAAWIREKNIRTLHVAGSEYSADFIRVVLAEVLHELGLSPKGPEPGRSVVFADGRGFLAVMPWPHPRAWRWQDARQAWEPLKDWRKIGPIDTSTFPGARRILACVPDEMRNCIEIACGLGHASMTTVDLCLLQVLDHLGKPGMDLARAQRWAVLALFRWAPDLVSDRPVKWPVLRRLARLRQREIISYFGFPATESAVRTLAKVPREYSNLETIRRLRDLLKNEETAQLLQRLDCINVAVVTILSVPWFRRIVGWPFLREISAFAAEPGPEFLIIELAALLEHSRRTNSIQQVGTFWSWGAMEKALHKMAGAPDFDWPSPAPTLPGIPGQIEPLITAAELLAEGRSMRHCAGTYAKAVRRGDCLVFRVLPEAALGTDRATLQLRPGPNRQWYVGQLFGPANREVSPGTHRFVESWLSAAHRDPQAPAERLRSACAAQLAGPCPEVPLPHALTSPVQSIRRE